MWACSLNVKMKLANMTLNTLLNTKKHAQRLAQQSTITKMQHVVINQMKIPQNLPLGEGGGSHIQRFSQNQKQFPGQILTARE